MRIACTFGAFLHIIAYFSITVFCILVLTFSFFCFSKCVLFFEYHWNPFDLNSYLDFHDFQPAYCSMSCQVRLNTIIFSYFSLIFFIYIFLRIPIFWSRPPGPSHKIYFWYKIKLSKLLWYKLWLRDRLRMIGELLVIVKDITENEGVILCIIS